MDKMILIDGNSLLNRAYYAMKVFSTKDGLPTNGVFGFIKLLFKIIGDESPKYCVVAFDVHAPTFRHKMYDGYKAQRKPMPEELVVQVPVLKDLLAAMDIKMLELQGYEADDIIGTVSRMFPEVHKLIYTGDRDSYQLVDRAVDVCFTKRGVSDLDRLTAENFYEKVGLEPRQIIDEKALMGDASDNIPGVSGVGPKNALALLREYGDLDAIYAHLDDLADSLKARLIKDRDIAFLSRTLATIDTAVPISLTLEECAFTVPFSETARAKFAQLEFRSLVDSGFFPAERVVALPLTTVSDLASVLPELRPVTEFSLAIEKEGVYVCVPSRREYFFPVRSNILGEGYFLSDLRPLFETLFSGDRCAILCDGKQVAHILDELNVTFSCRVEDVSLLRYLADSNQRPTDAKSIAKDCALPEEHCAQALLLSCREAIAKMKGTPEEELYRTLELPLSFVLLDMERTGVAVDVGKFSEFSDKFNRELSALSEQIYALAGVRSFNINSPFQLSEVLFEKLGLDPKGAKKNVRGGYSTSADILEKLAEEHEIARLILRYREIQKLLSTYIDGIRPLAAGGVIHTTYNQTMTTTGRLSSANPNLQNIPIRTDEGRELRKLFVAREGHILIDADYSQIELRLLAHFSECNTLVEAYRAGADIHAATASRVFGVPQEAVTPQLRRRAKTINFGIIYGMSAFGLAKDLGCPTSEAQKYISAYFDAHPEVKRYMDGNVEFAREHGYVTTVLGRKRYIPELKSSNYATRSFGERAAMNMPLQGSAADIIKIAMLRVHDRLRREGLSARMVLQVHDELVLDAPIEEKEEAARVLKEEMEKALSLSVPLTAEVSMGKSWYDAK